MTQNTEPPGVGQYIIATILGMLAISAGVISLGMNVAFGLKTGLVMAAIFALSDCAKIILPMIDAALGGSSAKRRLAYWTAVLISILAATSYLLETQATRLLQSQHASATVSDARADADRIRHELAQIDELLSAAALEKLTSGKQAAADREAGRGFCGPKCEGLKAEHANLVERLGQAKRLERLEAQLAATVQTVDATPVEALGSADTIAALTGGDKADIAQHEAIAKSVLMLIILELIAMFSGDAGNLFMRTWRARQAARKTAAEVATEPELKLVAKSKPATVAKGGRQYYLHRLERDFPALATRVHRGELSCYKACILAGIRKAPVKDWSKPSAYGIKAKANA